MRCVELRPADVPRLIYAGLFVSAAVGVAAAGADHAAAGWIGNDAARLAIIVLVCAATLVLSLRLVRRNVPQEIHLLVQQFADRLPFSRPLIHVCLGKIPQYSVAGEHSAC